MQAIVVESESRPSPLRVVGESVTVLANANETGTYEVFLQTGPEGSGPPPHRHDWDEAYFVVDGEIDVLLGERTVIVRAGGFVHIPAGTAHNYRTRTKTATFLSMTSRGGAARFFEALDRGAPELPPDLEKVVGIAARHGVLLAAPGPR